MANEELMEAVPRPDVGTVALKQYMEYEEKSLQVLSLLSGLAIRTDYASWIAKIALDPDPSKNSPDNYKSMDPVTLARTSPGPATRQLRTLTQEVLEMQLSRAVDSFSVYLVEMLRLVLLKEPRILSERRVEMKLHELMEYPTVDSLIRQEIEDAVYSYSRQSYYDLAKWFAGKKIPLIIPAGEESRVTEAMAIRNIIVHNRGRIDARYKLAVESCQAAVGTVRVLDVRRGQNAITVLTRAACLTDAAVVAKFSIETVPLSNDTPKSPPESASSE